MNIAPAFPSGKIDVGSCWEDFPYLGLSKREFFAAEASRGAADVLCDILTPPTDSSVQWDFDAAMQQAELHAAIHARAAYIYADAMVAAGEVSAAKAALRDGAPDLLASLREFVSLYDTTLDMVGESVKAKLTRARAAVARAEGRA